MKQTDSGYAVDVRNPIHIDDPIEVLTNKGFAENDRVLDMKGPYDEPLSKANPGQTVFIKLKHQYVKNDLIKKRITGDR